MLLSAFTSKYSWVRKDSFFSLTKLDKSLQTIYNIYVLFSTHNRKGLERIAIHCKLLSTETSIGRIILRLSYPKVKGFSEISIASNPWCPTYKRLTNDYFKHYTQTRRSPSRMAWVLWMGNINWQQNLRWLVRCTHDPMLTRSSSMFHRCIHCSTSSRYRRNQRTSSGFFHVW